LGIENVCLIPVSVYRDDNRSILDGLKRLKGKARAVVCIDPFTISDEELADMDKQGVCGVRLNLRSRSQNPTKEQFAEQLQAYAKRLRPLNWSLHIYIKLPQVQLIVDEIPKLGIDVVIDHIAHPDTDKAARDTPGYAEFMRLLENGQVWTKLSSTFRFTDLPDLDEYAKKIVQIAPERVVWATDWPHTGGAGMVKEHEKGQPQEYRKVDNVDIVLKTLAWCGHDEKLIQKIFVDNPKRLYRVTS